MTMRLTDRSIWTAPPPSPVRQASAQPVYLNAGLGTYYYWVVSHYPIGSVVSHWFAAYKAPDVISSANPVFLSWEASPPATSYDVLRTEEPHLPTDGTTPLAVATGVTQTTYMDQGAALSPYSLAGLMNGSPVDAWALLNNRDYSKPVLELGPSAVRMTSIIFSDGSELATASGGGAAVVTGINGVQGAVTLAPGPNATVTTAGANITINATAAGAAGQIQFAGAGTPPQFGASPNLTWNNGTATLNITGNLTVNGNPVGSQIPATGTAPASPQNGQLWYDTSVLRLKIWLGAWVQIA